MSSKKAFTIGFLGNLFEWYDFSVYTCLAPVIGKVFFGSSEPKVALLKTFIVFSLSFLVRPIGSLFFGSLGDRRGRAYSLKVSLFLMGVPAILIGLLPSYSSAGILSLSALLILRLIQGFAVGGEMPTNICYIYELADDKNRNFFCSFVVASAMLGILCGSLVATTAFFIFDDQQMSTWGWRIPFLLGVVVLIFLYYVRNKLMDENFIKQEESPIITLLKTEYKSIIRIFAFYAFMQTSFWLLFVWMPSYLNIYLGFSSKTAFLLGTAELGLHIILTLIMGYTAERIGRKRLLYSSIFSLLFLVYPAFIALNSKYLPAVILALFIFALCFSGAQGVMMGLIGEFFPSSIRCSGINISFTFATALFGGLAPTISSYLINITGYNLSPAFMIIAACFIALPAAITLKK